METATEEGKLLRSSFCLDVTMHGQPRPNLPRISMCVFGWSRGIAR